MKLLLVVYAFPPMATPRAFRWGAIARQFAEEGHDVDVVCAQPPGLPRHRELNSVRIHGAGGSLAGLRRSLSQPKTSGLPSGKKSRPSAKQRIFGTLKKYLWTSLYWPDAQFPYVYPAWRTARALLKQHRYDAMVSVSLPFSCHWVGKQLKREFPELPWIVDIGDPFAYLEEAPLNNQRIYRRLNIAAEAAVLRQADCVAVTTSGAQRDYQDHYGSQTGKIVVIPPLYSPPQDMTTNAPSPRSRNGHQWVYCGKLYRELRSPAALLQIFERATRKSPADCPIELHFYGDVGECGADFAPYADLIGKRLFLHGQVSREDVFTAQRQADVLINLGNTTTHQAPSKIVEYLGSGKPILNVAAHDQDTSREFLDSHPAALTIVGDPSRLDANVRAVTEFVSRLPVAVSESEVRERIRPFEAPAVANQYLELARDASALAARRYRQYRWKSTPVLTIPEKPRRAMRDGVRSLPTNTWRRRLLRTGLQSGARLGWPLRAHQVASALDGDAGDGLATLLDQLRSILPDHDWFPIATYASDPGRRRCYLQLLTADGTPLAYVKTAHMDVPSFVERELNASHALNKRELPFRRPRILHTGISGMYRYQVFEPLPANARPLKHAWQKGPARMAAALSDSTLKTRHVEQLAWWPDFVAQQDKYAEVFRQVNDHARFPVATCQAHGDFHRANMAVADDETWVFDWEDFSYEAPALTDEVRFYLGDRTRKVTRQPQVVTRNLIRDFAMTNGAIDHRAFWQVTMAISFLCARNNGAGVACSPHWPSISLKVDKDVANHRLSRPIQAA